MASDKLKSSHNSRVPFPDEFVCTPPPPADQRRPSATADHISKASAAANFHYVQPHPPSQFRQQWNPKSPHDDSSDDEDDDVEDDDDELDDDVEERDHFVGNVVTVAKMGDVDGNHDGKKTKLVTALGINKGMLTRDTGIDSTNNNENSSSGNSDRLGYHYRQYGNCPSTSSTQKDAVGWESCCGFSGRKEGLSGESIRSIFSDPISGMLMDDAMILPCGHSFGSGGMQHILRVKTCYTCSQPVSEDSIIPNLSLRVAVQAFKREEELHANRISKRRRERYDQDKGNTNDSTSVDFSSGRGAQFPFAVTDRVIIKGNKRTPPRFVGREAIVTAQCLNGWYVVKTLDNAESVKLQYRSLAKISDNGYLLKPSTLKTTTPNWL